MVRWIVGVLALGVVAAGLWAFEPWRVATSSEIDEPLPYADVAVDPASKADPVDEKAIKHDPYRVLPRRDEPEVVELAQGEFEDAEHGTSGSARVLELADGDRFLRFEDLDTSDGPDLHVWVTDQPSGGDWGSYDDGRYVRLGELKATRGNQNYEIPAGVDLTDLTSVVIWCDRFNVAFGTAPVRL